MCMSHPVYDHQTETFIQHFSHSILKRWTTVVTDCVSAMGSSLQTVPVDLLHPCVRLNGRNAN